MSKEQQQLLNLLRSKQEELSNGWLDYWVQYSSFLTWGFWVHAAILILPLIILYFTIDRKKALHIGFYGFNVHVWFTYIDIIGKNFGFWSYPYQVIPFMSVSFGLDVSLVPVVFMLAYQWVLNNNKNYYLYLTLLSAFLAFIFKPIIVPFDLLHLHKGTNYFHLFLGYLVVMVISKWLTNLFLKFERKL